MTIEIVNASEDRSHYVGLVYEEHYGRLRHYFLLQIGDAAEAEACVHETIRRFFFFMEDRNWEAEVKYISIYLMRIAGLLCSRKLAEKRAQHTRGLNDNGNKSSFNKIRDEVFQTIKEHLQFKQIFLRPKRLTAD
jgi:DNA-directed RNA polymerase specialized sigma24 family protein